VNCAALPEELIESELFGHARGAFTGAVADRRGKFETATGGTLFLDEVGDMSLKMQAKVLRALQEQIIEPVGGQASVRVDVRVIAATNKELSEEIRQGRFREDLYFRLNVIPVLVPPLRERGEDVVRLAEHFVTEFSREYGRRPKTLGPDALEVLRNYAWPGNVRELRNVIERLMIMVPRDVITQADLPFLDVKPGQARPPDPETIKPLFDARDAWERAYILGALSVFDGNISRTADALGLERSNLYKKMRGLGIAPREKDEAV
jgi:two-component system nitrogen regulation response regulator NtrX